MIIGLFVLYRWDIPDRAEEAVMIKPPHPSERGQFDVLDPLPRTPVADQLRLVEADDRFRQSVVVAVPFASNGGCDARFGEPLGVPDGEILVDSTGRRTTGGQGGLQEAVERLRRGAPIESLSRPGVEGKGDCSKLLLPMSTEVRAFREILP